MQQTISLHQSLSKQVAETARELDITPTRLMAQAIEEFLQLNAAPLRKNWRSGRYKSVMRQKPVGGRGSSCKRRSKNCTYSLGKAFADWGVELHLRTQSRRRKADRQINFTVWRRLEYKGKIAGDEIKFSRKVGDLATEEFVAKRVK